MRTCLENLKYHDVIHYLDDGGFPAKIIFNCYLYNDKQYVIDDRYGRSYYLPFIDAIKIVKKK